MMTTPAGRATDGTGDGGEVRSIEDLAQDGILVDDAVSIFGRNQEYSYSVQGPIFVQRSGRDATAKWVVYSQTRFDSKLAVAVPIGISPYFATATNVGITGRKDWFKHPDRRRPSDPQRRLDRVPNTSDVIYHEEVLYRSIWHYNRARFETELTVTGKLVHGIEDLVDAHIRLAEAQIKSLGLALEPSA